MLKIEHIAVQKVYECSDCGFEISKRSISRSCREWSWSFSARLHGLHYYLKRSHGRWAVPVVPQALFKVFGQTRGGSCGYIPTYYIARKLREMNRTDATPVIC